MSEQREDHSEAPPGPLGSDAPADSAAEPAAEPMAQSTVEPGGASSEPPSSSSGEDAEGGTESERQDGAKTVQLRGASSLGAVRGPPRPGGSARPGPPRVSPEGDSLVDLVAEPVRDEATELDWGDEDDDEPETATADRRMVDAVRARSAQLGRDDASQTLDLEALGSAGPGGADDIDDPSTFDTSAGYPGAVRRAPAPQVPGPPHTFSPTHGGVQSRSAATGAAPTGATTHQLHTEDEDGPTMVAFPQSAPDEEATQLHTAPTARGPAIGGPAQGMTPPPHGALGDPRPPLPPSERTANLPHPMPHAPLPAAAPVAAPPPPAAPMAGVQAALREAAVQAALAAATSTEDSPEAVAMRAERLEIVLTVLLGMGLVVGALGSYLSAASVADAAASRGAAYAGTSLVASFALFGCGLAALQRRPATKIGLIIVSAALLVFALARVLVIAAS